MTEQQLREHHDGLMQAPQVVKEVKLADRLDNIRETLITNSSAFQQKYLTETRDVYIPLAQTTSQHITSELTAVCDRLADLLASKKSG
jgi:(p)ppGpp synthase/HD superfamily hydrolase